MLNRANYASNNGSLVRCADLLPQPRDRAQRSQAGESALGFEELGKGDHKNLRFRPLPIPRHAIADHHHLWYPRLRRSRSTPAKTLRPSLRLLEPRRGALPDAEWDPSLLPHRPHRTVRTNQNRRFQLRSAHLGKRL